MDKFLTRTVVNTKPIERSVTVITRNFDKENNCYLNLITIIPNYIILNMETYCIDKLNYESNIFKFIVEYFKKIVFAKNMERNSLFNIFVYGMNGIQEDPLFTHLKSNLPDNFRCTIQRIMKEPSKIETMNSLQDLTLAFHEPFLSDNLDVKIILINKLLLNDEDYLLNCLFYSIEYFVMIMNNRHNLLLKQ